MFGDSTAAGSGRGGIGMSAAGPRLPGGCTSCPAGMSGGGRGSVALQGAGSGSCGGPQPCATPQQSSSTAVRSSATAGAPARLPPDAEREQGLRVIAAQSATSLCSCTIVHLPQTGDRQAPVQPPQASTVWTALPRQRAVVPGAGRGAHVLQAAASQEVARHVRLGLPSVSGVSEDRQTSRESMTRKLAAHFTFVFARQRTCQEVGIQPW